MKHLNLSAKANWYLSRSLGLIAFSWLVILPTKTVSSLLGKPAPLFYYLVLFLLSSLSLAFLWSGDRVNQTFSQSAFVSTASSFLNEKRLVGPILFLSLSLLLFVQIFRFLDAPFNWDENVFVGLVTKGTEGISFSHFLPRLISKIGMHWFGATKAAVRIPVLIFPFLLLVAIPLFLRRRAGWATCCLLVAHLSFNAPVFWYLSSPRGYGAMILFCFVMFAIVQEAAESDSVPNKGQKGFLFLACFGLGVLSHFFSLIFVILLLISLALWRRYSNEPLSSAKREYVGRFLKIPVAFVLVLILVSLWQLVVLIRLQWIFLWGHRNFLEPIANLSAVFGFGSLWAIKALLVFVFLMIFLKAKTNGVRSLSLLDWFVLTTNLFFLFVVPFFSGTAAVQPRFMLGFLVPYLYWFFELGRNSLFETRRWSWAAISLFLFILPAKEFRGAYTGSATDLKNFDTFFSEIRKNLGPIPSQCTLCVGTDIMCRWAPHSLDPWIGLKGKSAPCPTKYLIELNEELNSLPSEPVYQNVRLTTLYRFDSRYRLSRF